MKRMVATMAVMAMAALILAGCASVKRYGTDMVVKPVGNNQYLVDIKIKETCKNDTTILAAPQITVSANEEGQLKSIDPEGKNGFICTASVKEKDKSVQAKATVTIRKKGADIWTSDQTLEFNK
jgi:hypothetical protein